MGLHGLNVNAIRKELCCLGAARLMELEFCEIVVLAEYVPLSVEVSRIIKSTDIGATDWRVTFLNEALTEGRQGIPLVAASKNPSA